MEAEKDVLTSLLNLVGAVIATSLNWKSLCTSSMSPLVYAMQPGRLTHCCP